MIVRRTSIRPGTGLACQQPASMRKNGTHIATAKVLSVVACVNVTILRFATSDGGPARA